MALAIWPSRQGQQRSLRRIPGRALSPNEKYAALVGVAGYAFAELAPASRGAEAPPVCGLARARRLTRRRDLRHLYA
jgi:hypothetical protein